MVEGQQGARLRALATAAGSAGGHQGQGRRLAAGAVAGRREAEAVHRGSAGEDWRRLGARPPFQGPRARALPERPGRDHAGTRPARVGRRDRPTAGALARRAGSTRWRPGLRHPGRHPREHRRPVEACPGQAASPERAGRRADGCGPAGRQRKGSPGAGPGPHRRSAEGRSAHRATALAGQIQLEGRGDKVA